MKTAKIKKAKLDSFYGNKIGKEPVRMESDIPGGN